MKNLNVLATVPVTLAVGLLALFGLGFDLNSSATAATVVWDGGGDGVDLGLATNYVGDVLPSTVAGDTLQFNGTIAGPLNMSYNTTQPAPGGYRRWDWN